MKILISPMTPADKVAWVRMRRAMGPSWFTDDIETEARSYFDTGRIDGLPHCVLVARESLDSEPIGFAEVSLRDYAEGCTSHPVGYLEGWYVEPAWQGQGIGRMLVVAAEHWAAAQGCIEFASDAEADNAASIAAHQALGFRTICTITCFLKPLSQSHHASD